MTEASKDVPNERHARNAAAMRRLEELLRDAGPNITVRRLSPGPEAGAASETEALPGERPIPPATARDSAPTPGPHSTTAQPATPEAPAATEASRSAPQATLTEITGAPAIAENAGTPMPLPEARPSAIPLPEPTATTVGPAADPEPGPVSVSTDPTSPPARPEAARPAPRAARAEDLRHLTEAARGKLAGFVKAAGRADAPPAIPAAAPTARIAVGAMAPLLSKESELARAIAASRRPILAAGLHSFVINILMLAGPLFMLQVYDRVMTSGSIPTLVALAVMTAGLYVIIGVLELVRSRIVTRVGVEVDQRIADRVFAASLRHGLTTPGTSSGALRELEGLRQFLASPGLLSFFDAPWTPVYLLVIFLVHWLLGLTALVGAVLLLGVTWMSEARTRGPLAEANLAAVKSVELSETGLRNAESITAMGMSRAYRGRWQQANREALAWQVLSADKIGSMSALTKTLRLLGQSLMLAVGAWLALAGEISAGAIIAGTIIFGRALSPVEQAIGHWRSFLKARESYGKVEGLLAKIPEPPAKTALPAPRGYLTVQGLRVAAPETNQLILANVAFSVAPGQMLAVIGPSASGKSTLARALVGLWPPFSGQISLDGARLDQWDTEALGRYLGYLPQTVDLFAGTVRDNISRFQSDATDDEVVEAARQAHAHDMIMGLPKGYDTELGNFGTYLSSGQRQRIGLARALFRNPALVVLDEPNANLDRQGDEALSQAIDGMRRRGQAIILVSHRVQAIGKADLLLFLDRGVQRAFGPRREVMALFQAGFDPREKAEQAAPREPAQSGAKVATAASASQRDQGPANP